MSEVDYSRGELDAGDIADLKARDKARKPRTCPECGMYGSHTSGCPANEDEEEEEEEESDPDETDDADAGISDDNWACGTLDPET